MVQDERVEVADGIALRALVRGAEHAGSSVPFVLVHGLASNAHLWDGVAQHLVSLGHASAAIDLRGHGPAGRHHAVDVPGAFAFDAVAADIVTVIKSLGWDRPVVVGQSWGGNVVVEVAARNADAVRGIVCVDGGTIELRHYFDDFDACAERLRPPPLVGTPVADIERVLRALHPDWPESGITGQLANFEVRAD
ncbi:MAG TPA: alpha/beta fold hydrolase, partial [Acidimicrobiales bacterium]|nr:alpha/beta fold hydrolase [Acidimicrobiales bacterium]